MLRLTSGIARSDWRVTCGRAALARLLKGDRGAVAVEFALVSIPFVMTVLFILQMALTFFWIQCVEISTVQAARSIRIGAVQEEGLSAEQFKANKLCPFLRAGMDCSRVVVSIYPVEKEWDAARTKGVYRYIDKSVPKLQPAVLDQSAATYCPGGPGDMVFVDVVYKAPAFMGLLAPTGYVTTVAGERVLVLRGTTTIMNEPYLSTRPVPC